MIESGGGVGWGWGLKSFRIYRHIMQSVIKHLFAWQIGRRREGKGKKIGERFGIYNLAWRNTVTSCHHINLCRGHLHATCLSRDAPRHTNPEPFNPPIPQASTQTGRPTADWQNKHTSFNADETGMHKHKGSTLSSFQVLFFPAPLPWRGFYPLCRVSLSEDENNTE